MRKKILSPTHQEAVPDETPWLDLERLAEIEVGSEEPGHPVEAALMPGRDEDWRAAEPGEQTIRIQFDEPQRIRRIRLRFREHETARSQEFALGWSPDGGAPFEPVVRQQYNFSPPHTTEEREEYQVDLRGVKALELTIRPELGGGSARASLSQWRIA